MPTVRSHVLRGAVAGALAAGAWALQQPLDRRVFGVPYDDTELLGKLVTRGPAWRPVGAALHVANGAAFGAAYALLAPRIPMPAWARGPAAGMAEHLGSWPLTAISDRFHPARAELPTLSGDPRAFAQATWRHLLFGTVLGEVDRRLAPRPQDAAADLAELSTSNGHAPVAPSLHPTA